MLASPDSESRPPLLKTKISVPLLPTEFVHRHRLTDRISQGVKGPLTLVSAPAGFGKTNLVIEWAAETKSSVAWLTIDDEDNDPARFFRYLLGAFQNVERGLGEEALDFIQSRQSRGLEMGLTLLINELSALSRDLILVLDEFQSLNSPAICQGLDFLLKHLPRNLHLLIATRYEPGLDLASLRAKGKLVELGVDELRFTGEEIALFFRETTGLQLPPETISTLEKNTDGWITGLQMVAISLRHRPAATPLDADLKGDAHYLVDFLATEVLDRQPEEIRQFLLRTSALDQFCGPLCEAVIQPEPQPGYGTLMLERLEHANLFIVALDEKHEWFRYHHLFSDFLRHIQAETDPTDIPLIRKRAALWFERHLDLNEALKYALAAGDADWTADLIERNVETMIKTGEVFALAHWIGMLPDEIIHRRPLVSLTYAWGLIAAYRLDAARYLLDDIQKQLGPFDKRAGIKSVNGDQANAGLWNMYGGLAVCRSTLALLNGDAAQAAELSKEAANYLQEDNPFISSMLSFENSMYFTLSGDTAKAIESLRKTVQVARQANNLLVLIISMCQLAEMQALQGQLSQALVTLQKAQLTATNPDGSIHPLAGLVDIGFGEILLERDVLEQATEYLERGCRITKGLWSLSSLDGMVSLARLRQIRGDASGSQEVIEEAARMALSTESNQWDDAMVSALAARLALQREDLANAAQWWKKGGLPDPGKTLALEAYPYHILEYLQMTQVRFVLARSRTGVDTRDLPLAVELLASLLRSARRLKRVTSQIEILVLQSIAQHEIKDMDAAAAILLRALALGEPEDYRRVFLDEGQAIAGILARCQRIQHESSDVLPSPEYIESLLDALQPARAADQAHVRVPRIQNQPTTAKTEYGLAISLSAREMQVLALIAEGKSNQEISAELYLALNTVKRHAYNIYSKLDVKKRTHAVLKARQLGLIP